MYFCTDVGLLLLNGIQSFEAALWTQCCNVCCHDTGPTCHLSLGLCLLSHHCTVAMNSFLRDLHLCHLGNLGPLQHPSCLCLIPCIPLATRCPRFAGLLLSSDHCHPSRPATDKAGSPTTVRGRVVPERDDVWRHPQPPGIPNAPVIGSEPVKARTPDLFLSLLRKTCETEGGGGRTTRSTRRATPKQQPSTSPTNQTPKPDFLFESFPVTIPCPHQASGSLQADPTSLPLELERDARGRVLHLLAIERLAPTPGLPRLVCKFRLAPCPPAHVHCLPRQTSRALSESPSRIVKLLHCLRRYACSQVGHHDGQVRLSSGERSCVRVVRFHCGHPWLLMEGI